MTSLIATLCVAVFMLLASAQAVRHSHGPRDRLLGIAMMSASVLFSVMLGHYLVLGYWP